MQELPDEFLDAEITRALKFKPVVTPQQKQSARERLLQCAAEQSMLPPLTVEEVQHGHVPTRARALGQRALRVFHILFLDSSMYERARSPSPRFYEFYNPHGRYAFTIIHLSA